MHECFVINKKMTLPMKIKKCVVNVCVRYYATKKLKGNLPYIPDIPVNKLPAKSPSSTIVFGWGLGEHGALGHYLQNRKKMTGRRDPRFKKFIKPFRHHFGEKFNVIDIAAGFGFSAFSVKSNNQFKVWGTGLNTDSQIGYHEGRIDHPLQVLLSPVPINLNLKNPSKTKVISLSAGRAHLVIATDSEGIYTLGNNAYGQCGRAIVENEKYTGSRLIFRIPNLGGENVKSVECGQDHTLFLTEKGNVYACGWGADGQTGLGHYDTQHYPTRVLGDIEGENIVKISSKCDCVLALNDKGDVFGWGNSEYSQIFDKTSSLQQINKPIFMNKCKGFGKIIDIAAAGSHCLMLNEAGDVFSWGYGLLGQGPAVNQSWKPTLIMPILFGRNDFQPNCKVTSIYCGVHYSGAINNYGHIYMWGKNKSYCLGLRNKDDLYFPFKVYMGAVGKKLALGVDHSLALCSPL